MKTFASLSTIFLRLPSLFHLHINDKYTIRCYHNLIAPDCPCLLLHAGGFLWFVVVFFFFFQNKLFSKTVSGILSECQTVRTQIKPDTWSDLIWVQTVCKVYQQTTLAEGYFKCRYSVGGIGLLLFMYKLILKCHIWPSKCTSSVPSLEKKYRSRSAFYEASWSEYIDDLT